MATQLSHLPQCIGYDCGNVLSYLPVYDIAISDAAHHVRKKHLLTSQSVHTQFFHETRTKFFADRSDSVAIIKRDCLNDPSMYVINRKLLVVNKPQVFYNDDSCYRHCLALTTNALKWSESFLGDCMNVDSSCKFEEPI